jgi:hypothetical protein
MQETSTALNPAGRGLGAEILVRGGAPGVLLGSRA